MIMKKSHGKSRQHLNGEIKVYETYKFVMKEK